MHQHRHFNDAKNLAHLRFGALSHWFNPVAFSPATSGFCQRTGMSLLIITNFKHYKSIKFIVVLVSFYRALHCVTPILFSSSFFVVVASIIPRLNVFFLSSVLVISRKWRAFFLLFSVIFQFFFCLGACHIFNQYSSTEKKSVLAQGNKSTWDLSQFISAQRIWFVFVYFFRLLLSSIGQ